MSENSKNKQAYGTWPASITAEAVVSSALRFGTLQTNDGTLYWSEGRPEEGGRGVIMSWDEVNGIKELLPAPFSARSKVHEYGGGEFCAQSGRVFFVNADDQQIYEIIEGQLPLQITSAPDFRFADIVYDHQRDRLIAVGEQHDTKMAHNLPANMLLNIGLTKEERGGISILADDHDFYASPTLNNDCSQLAWLQWNLPDMPWESAELVKSSLATPRLDAEHISGGRKLGQTSACFQPVWSKSTSGEKLWFISDEKDYGQLFYWQNGKIIHVQPQDEAADALRPQWVFGMKAFAIAGAPASSLSETSEQNLETIHLSSFKEGKSLLQKISPTKSSKIKTTATSIENTVWITDSTADENSSAGKLAAIVTTDQMSPSVTLIDEHTAKLEIIRPGSELSLDPEDISKGRLKTYPTSRGEAYGLYYPPANKTFSGLDASLPPVIITIHGGPTGMANRGLKLKTQYWTNRGYGVFDVDYGGSAGYGKSYRERLTGGWGVVDVEDIISAATYLIDEKLADPEKLIISGGSSGGYTCLMALAECNLFKCASCNYPVTDLAQLIEITHKFELGYTYRLTGTTKENAMDKLPQRSVMANIDNIQCPVIFFQGEEDRVVPPSQPEAVYKALKLKGIKTVMKTFAGEGHGFRKSETIMAVLSDEESFFKDAIAS